MVLMVSALFSAERLATLDQFESHDKQNLLDDDPMEGEENVRSFLPSEFLCIIFKFKIV